MPVILSASFISTWMAHDLYLGVISLETQFIKSSEGHVWVLWLSIDVDQQINGLQTISRLIQMFVGLLYSYTHLIPVSLTVHRANVIVGLALKNPCSVCCGTFFLFFLCVCVALEYYDSSWTSWKKKEKIR